MVTIKRMGTSGSKHAHLKHWVAYQLVEGALVETFACRSEEEADAIVKRFRDTGKMAHPASEHYGGTLEDLTPVMVTKMHARVVYRRAE